MAGLTEEKRMEMEAEMNRFEQEILVPEDAPRMIIGANTFNKVQAALKAQNEEDEDPPPGTVDTEPVAVQKAPPAADVPPLLPPPPPPPPMMRPPAPPPALRPPPPPPRPAFMPPQLRHRPPAPPPRFPPGPPMNMPHGPPRPPFQGNAPPHHMYGGPPGPRPMGPGPGPRMGMRPNFVPAVNPHYYNRFDGPNNGPPPAGLSGISTSNSAVISKPKVVYSAAPVLKKAKTDIPTSTSDTDKTATEKVPTVSKPTTEAHPVVSEPPSVPPTVSQPGPVLQAPPPAQPQVPMLPDYSLQDLIDLPMDAELVPGHHALKKEKKEKKKRIIRTAAGQCWEDQTLGEWENDDFRIFCGDLGNEVTDDLLTKAFSKYGSFLRAKVVRDKRSNKSKGYGFISFKDPNDFVRAMREMNGKYVGNRPIKLRKSSWKDRNVEVVRRKDKEKKLLGFR